MAKKHLGQNFLNDRNMVDRLVRFVAPQLGQHFVEIGPGQGALTTALLPKIDQLDAIEIDPELVDQLRIDLQSYPHCQLHQADAGKFKFDELGDKLRLVGNLPYNLSTPLLFHFLQYATCFEDMHLMLQREVVERACAPPGNKTYGRLSVMLQYHAQVTWLTKVPASCFNPRPQVESAFMRVVPYRIRPFEATNERVFSQVVQKAFSQRRKTLRAIFKRHLTDTDWQKLDVDPRLRPECLTVEEFVRISNFICYNTNKMLKFEH